MDQENAKRHIEQLKINKIIFVKNKLLNLVGESHARK